ncbi:hypothetical protein N0V93_008374 [Gnomoniopsis smithogilvyi]|uniref:Mitochondrial carrier protein n=1 Tax=Gnomoniopsis smithogilvyi TaxID=1191159 RepID=A0A9W8YP13_9PEZI|nr:hypothetical protein N0V93_008374 [Gnomoniopsis smithogilvyi]
MSADFWAGYISGAVGIIIGNPLDILKVRLQAQSHSNPSSALPPSATTPPASPSSPSTALSLLRKVSTGTAAPILGYGALNALLFVSYNRSEALLNQAFPSHPILTSELETAKPASTTGSNLVTTFLAGAIGGLATWVVSTPTELIKCRSQLAPNPAEASSWNICKRIWRSEGGVQGFYFGGTVTAIRDSVGYGFYFWSYELSTRWMEQWLRDSGYAPGNAAEGISGAETAKVLLCGGLAGVATWVSIFPLDVIKTRVQAQVPGPGTRAVITGERTPLIGSPSKRLGAIQVAKEAYREAGMRVFFRGMMVCSVRAFIVNAVQWAVYEWIMLELGQGRKQRGTVGA